MSDKIELQPGDLRAMYGNTFFLVPGDEFSEPVKTGQTEANPVEAEPDHPAPPVVEQVAEQTAEETETVAPVSQPTATPAIEPTGAIQWRPKPSSQVLFILHQAELKEKELTDLLKKIVQSIGIPFDAAGFGIVKGEINQADLEGLPNPHGVVFDKNLSYGDNPAKVGTDKELFFSYHLGELKDNKAYKMELWQYLKMVKEKLAQ